MANQQLVDYIKGQLVAGVPKDALQSTLKGAGWADADIADAMKGVEGAAAAPAVQSAPKEPAVSAAPKEVNFSVSSAKPFAAVQAAAPKEPVQDVRAAIAMQEQASSLSLGVAPMEAKKDAKKISSGEAGKKRSSVLPIVLGVLFLLSAGGAVYLYMNEGALRDQVATLTSQNAAFTTQVAALGSSKDTLTAQVTNLDNQIASLTASNASLTGELSFFVLAPSASATAPMSVSLSGVLSSGKSGYLLTTVDGLVVGLKNGKDAKVDPILKPLAASGTVAEIAGTHLPGSNQVTITSVNGTLLQ